MYEYKVIEAHDFQFRPDAKRAQQVCDTMAAEGWRLIMATASAPSTGNGRLLLFFERAIGR